jgi:hypothetical protein
LAFPSRKQPSISIHHRIIIGRSCGRAVLPPILLPDLSAGRVLVPFTEDAAMKRMICGLSAAMLAITSVASAGQPGSQPASERAVMFYLSKPVGLSMRGRQEPLSFGLRLQQGKPMDWRRAVPLVDFRFRADGRRTMEGGGILMLDSFDSGTGFFGNRRWLAILATAGGAVALACILNAGICDGGSGDDEYTPPTG